MHTEKTVKVIRRKTSVSIELPDVSTIDKKVSRRSEDSISDTVAKDKLCYVNHHVEVLRKFEQKELWTVGKFYPYAERGPLYIDEPVMPDEILACEKKRLVMHAAGLRYLVIKKDMALVDCFMELNNL